MTFFSLFFTGSNLHAYKSEGKFLASVFTIPLSRFHLNSRVIGLPVEELFPIDLFEQPLVSQQIHHVLIVLPWNVVHVDKFLGHCCRPFGQPSRTHERRQPTPAVPAPLGPHLVF